MLDKKAGCQKGAWLIHQIIELPLKRRNIVLGVFEISLECLQLMLGWDCRLPWRTPTVGSQVAVSRPGTGQEKSSIHALDALRQTFVPYSLLSMSPPS